MTEKMFFIVPHSTDVGEVEKPCYRKKAPLVVGGTRTRVFEILQIML